MTAETGELAADPAAALAHGRRGLITGLLVNLTCHWKARARTLYDLVFTGLKA